MIIPREIARRYDLERPYVQRVGERVKDQVFEFCDTNGFAFLGRVKTANSLAEKLETGRFSRWNEIDDLYASSVIVPTLNEEGAVLAFLRSTYEEVHVALRGSTLKDPSVFRFDATRFVGRLRTDPLIAEDSALRKIVFEIQVRSAFEHAWCVTTHALTYKGGGIDWRRLRLVAQLKAAVEQLDASVKGFDAVAAGLSEHSWPDINAMRLIETMYRALFRDKIFPREAEPESWARFCENVWKILLGSTPGYLKNEAKVDLARVAMEAIDIAARETGAAPYPLSISLIEYTLGTLVQAGFISAPLKRYVPIVTSELLGLYPDARILGSGFEIV
jgi:ppGpp synthetase/RelA/SpoT-type nucleotidyltranferase